MSNTRSEYLAGLMLLSAVAGAMGCTPVHFPPVGRLENPGVVITAEDQSFTIQGGQLFKTPFYVSNPRGLNICTKDVSGTSFWRYHMRAGARRVRVQYPGMKDPLYGVLAFCRVYAEAGAVTRSYLLRITPEDVAATADGAIRVMFESTGANLGGKAEYGHLAWILWLSRLPL
jgi:hypothetical protein